ncbi:MAG: metal ABC transporter ATP-binding protein [Clostridia bacterium]|nr:metal ABC transporter ATP-binding protein [Clostridia bacterium]
MRKDARPVPVPGGREACQLCRIEVDDLNVKIDGQVLLSDVNLHIHCGELTALIGTNGAGKTTLLRALLGQIDYKGQIRHLTGEGLPAATIRTGYVPQQLEFDRSSPITVLDFVAASLSARPVFLGIGKRTREQAVESLGRTHCEHLQNHPMGGLSGGELQRVLLALALTPQPDLLILDEPVSGVDENGLETFYQMVTELKRRNHMAILLVSHDLDVVRRYADRVVLMQGTVIEQGPPEVVFKSQGFEKVFAKAPTVKGTRPNKEYADPGKGGEE